MENGRNALRTFRNIGNRSVIPNLRVKLGGDGAVVQIGAFGASKKDLLGLKGALAVG